MITVKAIDIVLALAKEARSELKMEGYEEVITNEGEVYRVTDIDEAIHAFNHHLETIKQSLQSKNSSE